MNELQQMKVSVGVTVTISALADPVPAAQLRRDGRAEIGLLFSPADEAAVAEALQCSVVKRLAFDGRLRDLIWLFQLFKERNFPRQMLDLTRDLSQTCFTQQEMAAHSHINNSMLTRHDGTVCRSCSTKIGNGMVLEEKHFRFMMRGRLHVLDRIKSGRDQERGLWMTDEDHVQVHAEDRFGEQPGIRAVAHVLQDYRTGLSLLLLNLMNQKERSIFVELRRRMVADEDVALYELERPEQDRLLARYRSFPSNARPSTAAEDFRIRWQSAPADEALVMHYLNDEERNRLRALRATIAMTEEHDDQRASIGPRLTESAAGARAPQQAGTTEDHAHAPAGGRVPRAAQQEEQDDDNEDQQESLRAQQKFEEKKAARERMEKAVAAAVQKTQFLSERDPMLQLFDIAGVAFANDFAPPEHEDVRIQRALAAAQAEAQRPRSGVIDIGTSEGERTVLLLFAYGLDPDVRTDASAVVGNHVHGDGQMRTIRTRDRHYELLGLLTGQLQREPDSVGEGQERQQIDGSMTAFFCEPSSELRRPYSSFEKGKVAPVWSVVAARRFGRSFVNAAGAFRNDLHSEFYAKSLSFDVRTPEYYSSATRSIPTWQLTSLAAAIAEAESQLTALRNQNEIRSTNNAHDGANEEHTLPSRALLKFEAATLYRRGALRAFQAFLKVETQLRPYALVAFPNSEPQDDEDEGTSSTTTTDIHLVRSRVHAHQLQLLLPALLKALNRYDRMSEAGYFWEQWHIAAKLWTRSRSSEDSGIVAAEWGRTVLWSWPVDLTELRRVPAGVLQWSEQLGFDDVRAWGSAEHWDLFERSLLGGGGGHRQRRVEEQNGSVRVQSGPPAMEVIDWAPRLDHPRAAYARRVAPEPLIGPRNQEVFPGSLPATMDLLFFWAAWGAHAGHPRFEPFPAEDDVSEGAPGRWVSPRSFSTRNISARLYLTLRLLVEKLHLPLYRPRVGAYDWRTTIVAELCRAAVSPGTPRRGGRERDRGRSGQFVADDVNARQRRNGFLVQPAVLRRDDEIETDDEDDEEREAHARDVELEAIRDIRGGADADSRQVRAPQCDAVLVFALLRNGARAFGELARERNNSARQEQLGRSPGDLRRSSSDLALYHRPLRAQYPGAGALEFPADTANAPRVGQALPVYSGVEVFRAVVKYSPMRSLLLLLFLGETPVTDGELASESETESAAADANDRQEQASGVVRAAVRLRVPRSVEEQNRLLRRGYYAAHLRDFDSHARGHDEVVLEPLGALLSGVFRSLNILPALYPRKLTKEQMNKSVLTDLEVALLLGALRAEVEAQPAEFWVTDAVSDKVDEGYQPSTFGVLGGFEDREDEEVGEDIPAPWSSSPRVNFKARFPRGLTDAEEMPRDGRMEAETIALLYAYYTKQAAEMMKRTGVLIGDDGDGRTSVEQDQDEAALLEERVKELAFALDQFGDLDEMSTNGLPALRRLVAQRILRTHKEIWDTDRGAERTADDLA
eukprot:g13666.t1